MYQLRSIKESKLLSLPPEILYMIIEHMIIVRGGRRSGRLRTICKTFDVMVMETLTTNIFSDHLSLPKICKIPTDWLVNLMATRARNIQCQLKANLSQMHQILQTILGSYDIEEYSKAVLIAFASLEQEAIYQDMIPTASQPPSILRFLQRSCAVTASLLALYATIVQGNTSAVERLCQIVTKMSHPVLGRFGERISLWSSMLVTIQYGNIEMMDTLRKYGASLDPRLLGSLVRQMPCRAPWILAVKRGDDAMLIYITTYLVHCTEKRNIECMEAACEFGQIEMLDRMIERHKYLHELPQLLSIAAEHGQLEVIKYLATKGLKFNMQQSPTETQSKWVSPFMQAVAAGQLTIVRYFVSKGASAKSKYGKGAMAVAARYGQLEIAQFLFWKGFSITEVASDDVLPPHIRWVGAPHKRNPVGIACFHNEPEFLAWLLSKDRKPWDVEDGEKYMYRAHHYWHLEIKSLLLDHGVEEIRVSPIQRPPGTQFQNICRSYPRT